MIVSSCSSKAVHTTDIVADDVSIYYGVSSYAMFGTDEETLEELQDAYNNLSLEPTDTEMDIRSMINIVFLKEGEPIASYGVDKNGVYCLDGKIENYKSKGGSLNYDRILEIYDKSKNEN